MEQVQQASQRLADVTATQIGVLWAQVETEELTVTQFRALAAALVARANTQGVVLADLGLTAEVMRQLNRRAAPLGLRPTPVQVDQTRIGRDINRILTRQPEAPEPELRQWARSEPLLTVATAIQAGMVARQVAGWTRGLSGGSCPLCSRLADGVVRPATVRMARHPGCDCIQHPQF